MMMNIIILLQERMIFICSFNSRSYPFGRVASCQISFYLDGISNIIADISPSFVKTGQDTFGDFVIKNWRIGYKKDVKHGKMIEISMTLTRDLTRIFMITYRVGQIN